MTPAEVMTAILLIFPGTPARACLIERRPRIEAALAEAAEAFPNVPTEVLAAVAFAETHLGCDHGEGGGWGAPISATRRHIAGTHMNAARILNTSFEVCNEPRWTAALRRFRTGLCDPQRQSSQPDRLGPIGNRYARIVIRVIDRIRNVDIHPSC